MSNGSLFIGGKDAKGNDTLVKKHLNSTDLYFHADLHGAMVVKSKYIDAMPDALRLVTDREKPILKAARQQDFNFVKLKKAWEEASNIK